MKTEYYINPTTLPTKTFSLQKAFRYAKLMEAGVEFPPVNVFINRDFKHLDFNDGRHRTAAAKMTGKQLRVKRSL